MRSGNVYLPYGYLGGAGTNSYYWSHSGYIYPDTFYFRFYVLDVNPLGGPSARYHGFSLRCLQE